MNLILLTIVEKSALLSGTGIGLMSEAFREADYYICK